MKKSKSKSKSKKQYKISKKYEHLQEGDYFLHERTGQKMQIKLGRPRFKCNNPYCTKDAQYKTGLFMCCSDWETLTEKEKNYYRRKFDRKRANRKFISDANRRLRELNRKRRLSKVSNQKDFLEFFENLSYTESSDSEPEEEEEEDLDQPDSKDMTDNEQDPDDDLPPPLMAIAAC